MESKISSTLQSLIKSCVTGNKIEFLRFYSFAQNEEGFNVNQRYGINLMSGEKMGRSLLHMAAEYGHLAIVKELLVRGADITQLDSRKMNAKAIAVAKGHVEVIDHLKNVEEIIKSQQAQPADA